MYNSQNNNLHTLSYKLKGKNVEIVNIRFNNEYILHRLNNIGLTKNAKIKILDFNTSNKVLHILINNVQYVLREKNCQNIDVRII